MTKNFRSRCAKVRWDPKRAESRWFHQSAALYIGFLHVQMLLHRPFMVPKTETQRKLGIPSLAICSNAARACSIVLETQFLRDERMAFPQLSPAVICSAIVLLVNIWDKMKNPSLSQSDLQASKADIRRCMDLLQKFQRRWIPASKYLFVVCLLL